MLVNSVSQYWALLLLKCCKDLGCKTICIAPGSRSTPLVMAADQLNNITIVTHFDERSLGFFALGVAKKTSCPVIVITTSGSAAANLIPSACEAFKLHVPVVYITADRPPELHDCGANQSMHQHTLFTTCTQYQYSFQPPNNKKLQLKKYIQQLKELQKNITSGPIHINFPFREPFIEGEQTIDSLPQFCLSPVKKELNNNQLKQTKKRIKHYIGDVTTQQPVLCIVANTVKKIDSDKLINWSKKNNIPLIAECSASLPWDSVIFRQIEGLINQLEQLNQLPEVIVCIGAKWISKSCQRLLSKVKKVILIHDFNITQNWLKLNALEMFNDNLNVTQVLPQISGDQAYYEQLNEIAKNNMKAKKITPHNLTDKYCVEKLSRLIEKYECLFIGNSLCARLVNDCATMNSKKLTSITQRGVSGIDGLVSTAAGIAYGSTKPIVALIGDLSFLYDTNGLYFIQKNNNPVLIIVLNNNGGRIFEELKIKDLPICEQLFVMPHNINIKMLAKTYSIKYQNVTTTQQLNTAIKKIPHQTGSLILECFIK